MRPVCPLVANVASASPMLTTNPFDDDKLREECGILDRKSVV